MTVHNLASIHMLVAEQQTNLVFGMQRHEWEYDYVQASNWWNLLTPLFNQMRKEREEKASGTL